LSREAKVTPKNACMPILKKLVKERTGCRNQDVVRGAAYCLLPLAIRVAADDSSGKPLSSLLDKSIPDNAFYSAVDVAGRQKRRKKMNTQRRRSHRRENRQQVRPYRGQVLMHA